MQIDLKLKKARKRVAQELENHGSRVSFCAGLLGQVFTIAADSIYPPSKDSGLYIRVAVDSITKEELKNVLDYPTHRKKEIWVLRFGESSTDPGFFLVFRIEAGKIIERPHNWPIEKVLSSPRKAGVRSQKEKVSSTESAS